MWAAFTAFFVYTAAQAQSFVRTISSMSFFQAAWVLTPTWMPPARKPWAAHTPPVMKFSIRIIFSSTDKGHLSPAKIRARLSLISFLHFCLTAVQRSPQIPA